MKPVLLAVPLLLAVPWGAAQAQVPGAYQRSCRNISQNGSALTALCKGSNGQYSQTTIDLDRCGGQGVSNSFGRLTCGNVQGSSRPAGGDNGYGDGGGRPRYDADDIGPPVRRGYGGRYDDGGAPGYAPPPRRYDPQEDDGGYPPPPPPRRRYVTPDDDE